MIIVLEQGAARLRLAPALGGRITALDLAVEGRPVPVLFPFPEDATALLHWAKGGLYPLLPYWGRIRDSQLATPEGPVALRPHPDAAPHTLHGPAHRHPWQLVRVSADSAELAYHHAGDDEWPWPFLGTLQVALPAPTRCEITLALANAGARPMPAGIGLHPYFADPGDARLTMAAAHEWPLDPEGLSGPAPGAPFAFAGPVPRNTTRQAGGWDGKAVIARPDARITVQANAILDHAVLHRPASDVAWFCVEPVSHLADAFNMAACGTPGTGAAWLAPGAALTAQLVLAV